MLSKPGTSTFNDIMEQAQAWRHVFEVLNGRRAELEPWLRGEKFGQIVLVGCGSSWHAALSAARVFHASGLNAVALPASEVLYAARPPYDVRIKTLLVGLSRSGATSETLWAVEKLKAIDPRLKALTIACRDESELAPLGDVSIALPGAHEEGVIATRSHTAMLLTLQVLASWLTANEAMLAELAALPDTFDLKKHQAEIQKAVALKPQHITFLGSGPFYGLAAASALLVREMANQSSDYMPLLEFRHGAQSSVMPHTLIVAYTSDALRKAEEEMIREIAVMRGPRMIICGEAENKTKMGTEFVFELGTERSELARLCLSAPIGQLFGFYLGIKNGVNPDRPKHVQPVVKLKERPGA
ncbi:MAG: SIS domain-containing protein [Proteobacteria bacterium]|nr:SIS domain-containing protein [Pseudomonadota bacterium]